MAPVRRWSRAGCRPSRLGASLLCTHDVGGRLGRAARHSCTTAFGLFLLMVLGMWLYTVTFTGSLPHLPHLKASIVSVCGSAVGNLLPAGGAAGAAATYKQLRSWGFSRRAISKSPTVRGRETHIGALRR